MDSNNNDQQSQFNHILPDNNLVWAILCTVLCCMPFGVYAIICSNKVNILWAQGDYQGAQKASDEAKKWSIIGAVAGPIIMIVIYAIVFAGVVASGVAH